MSLDTGADPSPLAGLRPAEAAMFLDFDGVLVDLAPHPDAVEVSSETLSLLAVLESETSGAFAIVTGREVENLRRHLPVVPQAVIGSHGAERWLPEAKVYTHPMIGSDTVRDIQEKAARATALTGVFVERKPTGAAIHFRGNPGHEDAVRQLCLAILAEVEGFEMLPAKCALELRPGGLGKDHAVATAMSTPPFAGRVPVYIGDDTTDEPALAWVADQGGVAIKVGPEDTIAPFTVPAPADVQMLLANWLEARWGGA